MKLTKIRVERKDGSVMIFSPKYYYVEYNNDKRCDELKIISNEKILFSLKPVGLEATTISYIEK